MKYGKQMRTESPPVRSFEGSIGKGKPYEGVNTIKEMGRSIHEIPRQDQSAQDMCKTPDLADRRVMEGSIPQVSQTNSHQIKFFWISNSVNTKSQYAMRRKTSFNDLLLKRFSFLQQIHPLGQPAIKHNVKSLITSPNKMTHAMPQLEAMDRAKYEESKAVRHTSVVNSTASVLRSTHQEAGKAQHSPSMYEDSSARRTPVNYSNNPVSRGSPMLRCPDGRLYQIYSIHRRMPSF